MPPSKNPDPAPPQGIDYVEKVKLRTGDLRPGMYVCELDRPWLETPFLLQGFAIASDADIEAVTRYCEFVYIDMQRTRLIQAQAAERTSPPHGKHEGVGKKDLEASASKRKHTTQLLKSFAEEIRFGQSPKLHLAKEAVSECVAGVISHPSAMMLMTRLRDKDDYSSQHAFSACIYSIVLGRSLGLDRDQLENLGSCGLLYDVGKLEIPDQILHKPGKLNAEEALIMQSHAKRGRDILMSGRDFYEGVADVAYNHHENLDGTGYPRGLQADQLNLNCKIVSIVDKYDALTSHRPYRVGKDHLGAAAILNALVKEGKIDGGLKSKFIASLGVYPPGTLVELSSGEVAIVISSIPEHRLRPELLVVRDPDKNPTQGFVDMKEKTQDPRGRPYRIVTVHVPGAFGIDISQYYDLIVDSV